MATFDQLSAEQRAIVELVLKRGQTYAELAEMLSLTEPRVRELARDALAELAPASARAVDADWRGQVADYVLGQQEGPEATATRGHLRRSEPARAFARSLLDSLDSFYEGDLPVIPEGDGGRERPSRRERRREEAEPEAPKPKRELSPAARAVIRRRRVIAAAGALLAVILLVVLVWPVGVLTGDDDDGGSNTQNASQQASRIGQIVLRPQAGQKGAGIAVFLRQGNQQQVVVQATGLTPSDRQNAYEVWLYNSRGDARSLGAQLTDRNGTLQGVGPLPADYRKYRFIDISRERIDNDTTHSDTSVLRGPLSEINRPQAGQ